MQLTLSAFFATLAGLALAPAVTFPTFLVWPGLLVLAVLFVFWRHSQVVPHLLAALFFFVFANLHYAHKLRVADDVVAIDALARKVAVSGYVTDLRHLSDDRSRLDIAVSEVGYQSELYGLSQRLNLRLYLEQGSHQFLPGDKIGFESRLRQPRLFQTPGEFNWPRYLVSQGIDLTGWIKSGEKIKLLGRSGYQLSRVISAWRNRIAAGIKENLPPRRAQLVRALLLGEGRVLADDVRQVLSQGGVSHLFAISGLHLGLIALLAYRLCFNGYRRFPALLTWQPPQRFLPLLILPLLFLYLVFTGDAVSTRRAFALAGLGAMFLVWRYYVNPLLLLAVLALLSLLVNPLLLWQAGWQLSFAGAAGILVWQPWWQNQRLSGLPLPLRYPVQLLLVTTAATLATLPFVLMNFHLVAPAGLIANLVCVPAVTLLILPLGLFCLVLFPLFPEAIMVLFAVCGVLLDGLVQLVSWLVALPGLGSRPLFLNHWQYLAVAVICAAGLIQACSQSLKLRFCLLVLCFGGATGLWLLPPPDVGSVALTMFSVGQGESLLLQNSRGQNVLVDGGGLYSKRFDVGERLLAPALGTLQIDHLDAVVLSHDHPDHRKGLIYLLDNFSVRHFYTAHQVQELHPSLIRALERNTIPCTIVAPGWSRLELWQQGQMSIYNPAQPGFSENDSSLTLYLHIDHDDGLLLTGDLERDGVHDLIRAGIPGPVSLLKLPHHGSRYSATDHLIDLFDPQFCFVSAGYQNRYYLPAREVVDYLQEKQIPLWRTDMNGTITAVYDRDRWLISDWKGRLFD